jgi:uncharacterized protein
MQPFNPELCWQLAIENKAGQLAAFLHDSSAISTRFQFGQTLLHGAASAGAFDCIKVLLAHGADIEAEDDAGHTPLIAALGAGDARSAKMLLEAGARLEYTHSPKDTSATREQKKKDYERILGGTSPLASLDAVLKLAGVNSSDLLKSTVDMVVEASVRPRRVCGIHHCRNQATLELLVNLGGNLNVHDDAGYWPLKTFAEEGESTTVAWLLGHGAQPDFTSTGETALHMAVAKDHVEIARQLLKAGANPNQQDVDGCVPLWQLKSETMLDLLLSFGADPTVPDQAGFLPSKWATDSKLKSRLRKLEKEARP